jgi:bacteriorhodopsin
MKPRWRGTVIAVASLIAFHAVFYGSADRNSSSSKMWLFIFFVTGSIGGLLAIVDSIRQIAAAARSQHTKKSDEKNDAAP